MTNRIVYATVTDKQKEGLQLAFPDVKFDPKEGPNPHLFLHYSRRFLEQDAILTAKRYGARNILDIGGTPERAGRFSAAQGLGYHSCNPIMDGADLVRRLARTEEYSHCEHKGQDCDCTSPDALQLIHTLYYFTPDELYKMIEKSRLKVAVAVTHTFEAMEGSIPLGTDESHYLVDGDSVIMNVKGNSSEYVHSALHWLTGGSVHTAHGTLAWAEQKSCFGAKLLVFTISPEMIPLTTCNLSSTTVGAELSDPDLRGLRNTQQIVGHVQKSLQIDSVKVLPFGFLVRTGTKQVVVPNVLYDEACLWVVGKKRSKANWDLLMQNLKGKVGRVNVPSSSQWVVVLHCAALAFTNTLYAEIETHGYLSRWKRQFALHDKFLEVYVWFAWFFELLTNLHDTSSGQFLFGFELYSQRGMIVNTIGIIINSLLVGIIKGECKLRTSYQIVVWFLCTLWWAGKLGRAWVRSKMRDPPSKYSAEPSMIPKPKVGSITATPDLYDVKESAGRIPLTTYDRIIPVTCANDDPNKLMALNMRCLQGVEEHDFTAVSDHRGLWEQWLPKSVLKVITFPTWIKECNRRNDKARVAVLTKAYNELKEDPSLLKFTIEPFVKDEAYPAKGAAPKPRLIFATNNHYLCKAAPIAYSLGKKLKEVWNSDYFVYYTSGATASKLGEWFQSSLDALVDPVIIETDFAEYEARIHVQAMEEQCLFYEHMGASKEEADIFRMQKEQKGGTRTGLRWKRKAGRASAVPDTSVGNSIINALVHLSYLCGVLGVKPEDHLRMAVLGDDNLLIVSGRLWELMGKSTKGLEDHIASVGMKPETKSYQMEDCCKAEFCSGWFAAHEIDGKMTCVWTPKVGRVIMKTLMIKPQEKKPMAVAKGICQGLTVGPTCPLLRAALKTLQNSISGETVRMQNYDWNPTSEKMKGVVKSNLECVALRYDLTVDQVKEVEAYLKMKMTGRFPINLDPAECPPLRKVVELDVGFGDLDAITVNLNQRNPNLSTQNRDPVHVDERFQRTQVPNPPPLSGQQ